MILHYKPRWTPMQQLAVAIGLLIAFALVVVLPGCSSDYLAPANEAVLTMLPAQQHKELAVFSQQHSTIWDLRFHSPDSCPFFYTADYWFSKPNQLFANKGFVWWSQRVYRMYRAKHLETDHCTCSQVIARMGQTKGDMR
jgi:hypothetical protein